MLLILLKDAMMTLGLNLAKHRGCYYHFMQAFWRKVQSLGLEQCYMLSDPTLNWESNFLSGLPPTTQLYPQVARIWLRETKP